MACVFGPVPSRRLGFSLGIDITPLKACTLDCVYCQLGRTPATTIQRSAWIGPAEVLNELRRALDTCGALDYVTFSGSGEPTLHSGLGEMIDGIHALCDVPVAVITNGTLMTHPDVRRDVGKAELAVPSLDAVTPEVFRRINRPHPALDIASIIEGLVRFRGEYRGQLWIEVMLIPGINDSDQELARLGEAMHRIRPDKIQINSPCRPGAEAGILPADTATLERAREVFGSHAEIIGDFTGMQRTVREGDIGHAVIDIVRRHPSSARQISQMLGIPQHAVQQHLQALVAGGSIRETLHNGLRFYSA